jgi:hypothetical protein
LIEKNKRIGIKILETAVRMDETLVDILKLEVKHLKQQVKNNTYFEDVQRTDKLIRNIILALTVTEERMRTGLDIIKDSKDP